jgi:hypothetical protein
MPNDPKYNWVYKELVKSPEDVSGALAYVLYKNAKIEYIESLGKQQIQPPSDAQLAEFHRVTNLPDTLSGYRERADLLLESFLDNVLAAQLAVFKAEMRTDAVIQAAKPSFLKGVVQNIVAGFVTTLITFGFVIGAWMYDEGPMKILTGAIKRMIEPETQASTVQGTPQPSEQKK